MNIDRLTKLQQDLVCHMLDQPSEISQHIVDAGQVGAKRRLSIYRNGYRIRLKATIETDHPVLGVFLGDDLFDLMVEGYIDSHPSCYPSLRQFADKLPDYLAEHEPFCQHVVITELAAFERCLIRSFDAAGSPRLAASDLESISADNWPDMTFMFHPSVQQMSLKSNAIDIWQALKNDKTPPPAVEDAAVWLIWRNHERLTEFRSIDGYESALIQLASEGKSFSELCDLLLEFFDENEALNMIIQFLQGWLARGTIAFIKLK